MRTKDEWIARWRLQLAGLAMFGVVSDAKDGPLQRAARWMEIPAQVEKLLAQMYADLDPKPAHTNGKPAEPNPVRRP